MKCKTKGKEGGICRFLSPSSISHQETRSRLRNPPGSSQGKAGKPSKDLPVPRKIPGGSVTCQERPGDKSLLPHSQSLAWKSSTKQARERLREAPANRSSVFKKWEQQEFGIFTERWDFFPALTSDLPCSGRAPAPCGDRAWSCGHCRAHTGPKINGIFPVWCPRDAGTSRILHFFCSKFRLEIKEFALSDIWVALLAWHKWPLLALNPQPEGFDPCGIKTMEFPSFWHFWTN